jgi:FixJ family two-component response regulator
MATCYILDDQYGATIYTELEKALPERNFPIKKNIYNPLSYLEEIIETQPEIILLDNYFPGTTREEALGEEFLSQLLERNITTNIICISDYGKKLMERYFSREIAYQKGFIKGWIENKDGRQIANLIKEIG